ncbi:MAG: 4Fe-4S double cluster binding domain-containing protein [Promethearchaeota archaeon]
MYSGKNIDFEYKYRTLSVDHLEELQEDIDKLRRAGLLSDNEVYRSYIDSKKFEIPESFPNAKSIIILAIFSKIGLANFHLNGKKYEVMIPPNYYDDGTTFEDFEDLILNEIIKEPGYKVEFTLKLHRKLLAVRSGLGRYGRNNICYIEGWGSMFYIYTYFTDFKFEKDHWTEIKMMDQCENCTICFNNCITKAIPSPSDDNFVINATNCIPVYNEIPGVIPDWIPAEAHNALIGCMRCQKPCPSNSEVIGLTEQLGDITEEETKKLLDGCSDEDLVESLAKKLKMFTPEYGERMLHVIKRNLEFLIN